MTKLVVRMLDIHTGRSCDWVDCPKDDGAVSVSKLCKAHCEWFGYIAASVVVIGEDKGCVVCNYEEEPMLTIDDYGDAINALVDNKIPLRDVIKRYRDIALAKSMPDDMYDDMYSVQKPTMTEQTHKDIVGLIEAEMGEVACGNYANSSERLACVIEGRLGYETPKKSVLPNMPSNLGYHECPTRDGRYDIYDKDVTEHITGAAWLFIVPNKDFARLMAAAPKLREAAYAAYQELQDGCENRSIEKLIPALREAGADI